MADPLEELKKIASAEQEEARGQGEAERRSRAAKHEREQRKARNQAASAARAPGFLHTMRFFGLGFFGLAAFAIFGGIALESDWWDWKVVGTVAGVWGLLLAGLVIDGLTWRRRLPFELVGFESIAGKDGSRSGDDRVPWLSYEVAIRLVAPIGGPGGEALRQTLEILATRVNRAMQSDGDADFGGTKVWRTHEDGHVSGEATLMIYTTQVVEKWLRREVRLLHRAFPVCAVHVTAKYTGSSFHSASD